jgi:hypothetical protein
LGLSFCEGLVKTLSHIFLDCDLALFLWNSSSWPNVIGDCASRPISEWILAILSPVVILGVGAAEVRKFQLFASLVLDFIWRARNLLIYEGTIFSPSRLCFRFPEPWNSILRPGGSVCGENENENRTVAIV